VNLRSTEIRPTDGGSAPGDCHGAPIAALSAPALGENEAGASTLSVRSRGTSATQSLPTRRRAIHALIAARAQPS